MANVNSASFGKVYAYPVDGMVFAQPLVKSNLTIPGKGTFNVVFIATQHSSIYALDADTATPIWHRSFINPAAGLTTRTTVVGQEDILPEVSITSTPVIDPATGTMYVVAETQQSGAAPYYWLHALDITTGEDTVAPTIIQASIGAGQIPLRIDAATSQQRAGPGALQRCRLRRVWLQRRQLSRGSAGSWGTTPPRLRAWRSSVLRPAAHRGRACGPAARRRRWTARAICSSPPATATSAPPAAWGDSILKLSTTGGLSVLDYFTPFNQAALSGADLDLASAGMTLLPDARGQQRPSASAGDFGQGRGAVPARPGQPRTVPGVLHHAQQPDRAVVPECHRRRRGECDQSHACSYVSNSYNSPAYWNNRLYFCGVADSCKLFTMSNGLLNTSQGALTPASKTAHRLPIPGRPAGDLGGEQQRHERHPVGGGAQRPAAAFPCCMRMTRPTLPPSCTTAPRQPATAIPRPRQ